jgi:hypothetical protein
VGYNNDEGWKSRRGWRKNRKFAEMGRVAVLRSYRTNERVSVYGFTPTAAKIVVEEAKETSRPSQTDRGVVLFTYP